MPLRVERIYQIVRTKILTDNLRYKSCPQDIFFDTSSGRIKKKETTRHANLNVASSVSKDESR